MSSTGTRGSFDTFADSASRMTSRATFFAICLALVVIWLPSWFLIRDLDTWQLIMVTVTNVATFLMVALVQNSQWRNQVAMNRKLDALSEALAIVMRSAVDDPSAEEAVADLTDVVKLEDRVSPGD